MCLVSCHTHIGKSIRTFHNGIIMYKPSAGTKTGMITTDFINRAGGKMELASE